MVGTYSSSPNERSALLACIAADSISADGRLTTRIDMARFRHVLVTLAVGTHSGTTTVTLETYPTITGGVATVGESATFSGAGDSGKIARLEARSYGLGRYLDIFVDRSATVSMSLAVIGLGGKDSREMTLVGRSAQIGIS